MLQFRLLKKRQETSHSATLFLDAGAEAISYEAGQFITLLFDHLGPKEIRRSYSLSSAPQESDFSITVKQQTNGVVSNYLVNDLAVGDSLLAFPPAGQFTLPNKTSIKDILLFAGGSGITPLYSILKYALHYLPKSRIQLLYANRKEDSIIFHAALNQLAKQHPNRLQIHHLLSNPNKKRPMTFSAANPIQYLQGRASNDFLERWVKQAVGRRRKGVECFICGPEGLMMKTRMTLKFMGLAEEQIHQEIFVIKGAKRPEAEDLVDSQVRLRWKEQVFDFGVKAGQTVLEGAKAAGIDLPYSCQSGVCTLCASHCERGEVMMYTQQGQMNSKNMKGLALTCVGYPMTAKLDLVIE